MVRLAPNIDRAILHRARGLKTGSDRRLLRDRVVHQIINWSDIDWTPISVRFGSVPRVQTTIPGDEWVMSIILIDSAEVWLVLL